MEEIIITATPGGAALALGVLGALGFFVWYWLDDDEDKKKRRSKWF